VVQNIHETTRVSNSGRLALLTSQLKDATRDKNKYIDLYKDAVNRAEKESLVRSCFPDKKDLLCQDGTKVV
jgi:hypothetical protein